MIKRAIGVDAAACALGPSIGVFVALMAGQETSWDFRNYHWYNAYALLAWRYDQDVAVAHHATSPAMRCRRGSPSLCSER